MAARQRMAKELLQLEKSPPEGIACYPVNDNMMHLRADITGPSDSPYGGGIFRVDIQIPDRYPFEPPRCQFKTQVYHPNIDDQGRICLDTLKMQPKGSWTPSLNVSTVLLTLRLLLANPNPNDPLLVEIAAEYKDNKPSFLRNARHWTEKYAMGSQDDGGSEGCSVDGIEEASQPKKFEEVPMIHQAINSLKATTATTTCASSSTAIAETKPSSSLPPSSSSSSPPSTSTLSSAPSPSSLLGPRPPSPQLERNVSTKKVTLSRLALKNPRPRIQDTEAATSVSPSAAKLPSTLSNSSTSLLSRRDSAQNIEEMLSSGSKTTKLLTARIGDTGKAKTAARKQNLMDTTETEPATLSTSHQEVAVTEKPVRNLKRSAIAITTCPSTVALLTLSASDSSQAQLPQKSISPYFDLTLSDCDDSQVVKNLTHTKQQLSGGDNDVVVYKKSKTKVLSSAGSSPPQKDCRSRSPTATFARKQKERIATDNTASRPHPKISSSQSAPSLSLHEQINLERLLAPVAGAMTLPLTPSRMLPGLSAVADSMMTAPAHKGSSTTSQTTPPQLCRSSSISKLGSSTGVSSASTELTVPPLQESIMTSGALNILPLHHASRHGNCLSEDSRQDSLEQDTGLKLISASSLIDTSSVARKRNLLKRK